MADSQQWPVGGTEVLSFAAPAHAVFDLVTQVRFWHRWQLTAQAVAGVVERPYRVGDRIYEAAGPGGIKDLYWHVTQQEFPGMVLTVEPRVGVAMDYRFSEDVPGQTLFTRTTRFREDCIFTAAQRGAIAQASAASAALMAEHVAGLLNEENRVKHAGRVRQRTHDGDYRGTAEGVRTWPVDHSNSVVFEAPAYAVFDMVTQARLWRKWHFGGSGIAGVVNRPLRVGDMYYEYVVGVGSREQHLYWECIDQHYPTGSLSVERSLDVAVDYRISEHAGRSTFTRTTLFGPNCPYSPADRDIIAEVDKGMVWGFHRDIVRLLAAERETAAQAAAARREPVGRS